ncbi:DUF2877 domain-containing protein [Bradyrhizobium erythrophlei]|uniref:oxamate carbamoyltransferase subunit AllH family protein n=1 Tax=Bradyrhizobium erythrophlei TaxID=1437360 RepID=UPI0035E5CED4
MFLGDHDCSDRQRDGDVPNDRCGDAVRVAAAVEVGLLARTALRDGAAGHVMARFERSFYLTLDGTWICVGQPDIGSGPLHLLGKFDLSRPTIGAAVRVAESSLWIAGRPFAKLTSASVWTPAAAPRWSKDTLRRGLRAIDEVWSEEITTAGLAVLGADHAPIAASPLVQAAMPGVAALERILVDAASDPRVASGLAGLIGLGPGLTPSGDDLIGGALIALAALGHTERRDALWNHCRPLVEHTNDISRAHLQAAARGYGAAALHAAIHATMGGEVAKLRQAVSALTAIGHSSGLDAFAGSLIVLRHAIRKQ